MRVPKLRPLLGPALLTLCCFALRGAMPQLSARLSLPQETGAALVLTDLAGIGAWLSLAWSGARLFDMVLLRAGSAPRLLGDLLRAVLFGAAGLAILADVFGQSAIGLVTTSSVLVAVIGFALRNIISDVFSGLVLGVDPPYRIGDWIETAEGATGRVEQVSWRTTRLVSRDGVAQVVPNGLVAARRLVAYGPAGSSYRVALRMPLDPALPPERAKRILLAGALDAGRAYPGLRPDVLLQEIAEGAAIYLLRFHVPDHAREAVCRDAVASAALRALQHVGLEVARPARAMRVERAARPPARPRRAALLRRIALFRGVPEEERVALEQSMRECVLRPGAAVVREGEAGESLFIVAEGALEVTALRDGRALALDRMVPGDVFGEMSLLTGAPRSATITAATEAVVFEISREDLQPIVGRHPELLESFARMMAERQAQNAGIRPAEDTPPPGTPQDDLLGRLRAFFKAA